MLPQDLQKNIKKFFLYFCNNTKKEKESVDKIEKQSADNKERKRNFIFTIK